MQRLYREEYGDFTVRHFPKELRKRHNYTQCYAVTRLALQPAGLVTEGQAARPALQGAAAPSVAGDDAVSEPAPGLDPGDGLTHRWTGALDHDLDLMVTLDDAAGASYSAILIEQEVIMPSFLGLQEAIAAYGLFGALYTYGGSHYFVTPEAGAKADKRQPTQMGQALARLCIRHIPPMCRRAAAGWSACSAFAA